MTRRVGTANLTPAEWRILEHVARYELCQTGQRTGDGRVYGRGVHRLIRAGLLAVVEAYEKTVLVELTAAGREALRESL